MQWEFAGRLGPEAGRYVVRRYAGDDPRHVVVIGGLEAPRRRRRLGRPRARGAAPGASVESVEVTRATVIGTEPLPEDGARAWLEAAAGDLREATVAEALGLLNRAIFGHRLSAADPYVAEVSAEDALATRVGYGSGEQVAEGDWEEARELPPAAPKRSVLLAPQQRLAALLSGRDVALACEELALRARLDLEQGREREAALQLSLALDTALSELEGWRGTASVARRLDELPAHREAVAAAAATALQGGLQPAQAEAVRAALARLEATLRARTVEG